MIKVGEVEIGEGIPKICAPIVEADQESILDMGETLRVKKSVDIIEWRIDFFEQCFDVDEVLKTASLLRSVVGKKTLLATFRTKNEGGEKEIEKEVYIKLLENLSNDANIDMVDVEVCFMEKADTESLIKKLRENVVVVGSYHDFDKTPSYDEICKKLKYMKEVGADIPKIACMPENKADVFNLMRATNDFVNNNKSTPVITMSMGKKGKISRISGESFGSAVTFGCLGKASAPGQINVDDLKMILEAINE